MTAYRPSLAYRTFAFIGQKVIFVIETIISLGIKDKRSVLPVEGFSWVKNFEQLTLEIKKELLGISMGALIDFGEISSGQKRIISGSRWKTFFLYAYGQPAEKNIKLAPVSAKAVKEIPGMTTAFFSVLEPGTTLTPHRGPYKGVLRYHLGLVIPQAKEQCGIKIADDVYHWEEGQSLIFDDTFIHEAWNNSNENRIVLFVDFVRPISFPFNIVNNAFIFFIKTSPFIRRALRKIEKKEYT